MKSRSNSSWNQPVLSNKGKVSCSRKQRGSLMGLEPTTSTLRVRRATHCATPPQETFPFCFISSRWTFNWSMAFLYTFAIAYTFCNSRQRELVSFLEELYTFERHVTALAFYFKDQFYQRHACVCCFIGNYRISVSLS